MRAPLSPGAEVAGYRIERELGRGGMGVVYLAEQLNLGRRVALKVIATNLSDDPSFRQRFAREARLAASLDHPNVVPVFEAGSVDGLLFLAMRYVRGTDLDAVLSAVTRIAPRATARVVEQVAAALDAAHAAGLIHRDVKPANILLAGTEPESHVYLTDFGLTKETGASGAALTNPGQWVGTVDYVAPEQLDGRQIDARTDVYSLGCVLFQMLAGRVPYPGGEVQKMWGHANTPPPVLDMLESASAAALEPIVARAMAKDPEDRYPSAGDLGRAVIAAAEGMPVEVPERSVAKGAAAGGTDDSVSSHRARARSGAHTKIGSKPPPWMASPPSPPPTTAGVRPPAPPRSRTRLLAVIGAAAVLAAGVAAGVLLASRGDPSTPLSRKGRATAPAPPPPRESNTPRVRPRSPEIRYSNFTPSSFGYSADIPTGKGWSEPSESEPTPGRLYRTTIKGPGELIVMIDYTPFESAKFGDRYQSRREVGQVAFGAATEYVFQGGSIPQCQASKCVDYIINDESRGAGYGVLAGGGADFTLARQVARRIADSLTYEG